MKQQTAVEWLIEQLQAPCRGIPTHIIEQAKEMEQQQAIDLISLTAKNILSFEQIDESEFKKIAEQYYNETYGGEK